MHLRFDPSLIEKRLVTDHPPQFLLRGTSGVEWIVLAYEAGDACHNGHRLITILSMLKGSWMVSLRAIGSVCNAV
ncbi:hypothetical protein NL676_038480 [Syzygium grande]|nr:hypothetical protein NL676_038480 [Syzygium grande]